MKRCTRNLAILALVLGAVAVLGDPYHGNVVTLDTRELAAIVETEVDHVEATDLADWIIQGNTEYRLLDLRSAEEYAAYHIPSAEHVAMGDLPDYPLFRNETIVLYSGGGIHSAQGWMLLRAEGFRGVYMLLGGLDAWKDDVLFPALPDGASAEETAAFERARTVSSFFGGTPRTGVASSVEAADVPMPEVEMPARPVTTTRKKKKKEGC